MAVDLSREQGEWLAYMQREKGVSRADALRIEAEARASLANASEGIRRWETREEFYALMGVACPPKPKPLPGFKAAAKRIEAEAEAERSGAPAAARKVRARSARVENLHDARELAKLRADAGELASVKDANRQLARLVDAARDELAAANARIGQLEAQVADASARRDGTPGAEWEARVRDLEAQVAGFMRWGVAS